MYEQRYFRAPLLTVLAQAGGSLKRSAALDAMESLIGHALGPGDRLPLADRGREEGWKNRTSWEVKDLKNEGLLEPTSVAGRGVWALTSAGEAEAAAAGQHHGGLPYVSPARPHGVSLSQPFDVDPDLVDRALESHYTLVEDLADWVRTCGMAPLLPGPGHPVFDLAWWSAADHFVVAEIKSLTTDNEERQLRLGLGQVLRYRHALSGQYPNATVDAWLVVERAPSDRAWLDLTKALGVHLTWRPFRHSSP